MKSCLVFSALLLAVFIIVGMENAAAKSDDAPQYKECIAVSLHTMNGQELDSIVRNNRKIEDANLIPEGWSVVGVTEKSDGPVSRPYLVICK